MMDQITRRSWSIRVCGIDPKAKFRKLVLRGLLAAALGMDTGVGKKLGIRGAKGSRSNIIVVGEV